jgi:hypothetical protein
MHAMPIESVDGRAFAEASYGMCQKSYFRCSCSEYFRFKVPMRECVVGNIPDWQPSQASHADATWQSAIASCKVLFQPNGNCPWKKRSVPLIGPVSGDSR